jgi:hypothetical protein
MFRKEEKWFGREVNVQKRRSGAGMEGTDLEGK